MSEAEVIIEHRPGKGCGCDGCEKRRAYQREYNRKVRGRAPAKRRSAAAGKPVGPTGRLIEVHTGDALATHWMPKEGDAWTCPQCGREFVRLPDGWVLVE